MLLNNLNDLNMLILVVDCKGFSAAAKLKNISPATVSKQIARLEKQLGIQLFNRSTRHLEVTEAGQEFVNQARIALAVLEEAEAQLNQTSALKGQLSITAPLSLGCYYVAPLVAKFNELHPKLHIDLRLTDHVVDLYSQAIDIAIRIGQLADSTLIAKYLTTNKRILVAAPSYLAQHASLEHPKQLVAHQCLLFSYPGYKQNKWTLIYKNNVEQREVIYPKGFLSADNGDALRQLCILGKGIFLCESWYVAQDIKLGHLVHILADWQESETTISAVYQQQIYVPRKITEFVNYIAQCWFEPPWI